MSIVHIESADDSRIANYRAVPDPQLLRDQGLFVAEGRLVVERLLQHGTHRVQSLLLSEAARAALEPELARLGSDVPIFVCALDVFRALTGFNLHRGCLALVERPPARVFPALIQSARLVLVLEDLANADNVGGVFRNAAAFGADAVLLTSGCCDPLYRKAIRTSMGAVLRVPFARITEWPGAIDTIRSLGFTLVALTPRQPALPLTTYVDQASKRIALVVGSEGTGLSESVERAADVRVRVPIGPDVDSLNVSVAVGIALHAIGARRCSCTSGFAR